MPAEPQPDTNQLKLLNTLTLNQKISLVVLAAAVVVGVVSLIYLMNQEEYQTLYSDLGSEEANTVIERLKTQKVLYQIADSGKSIKVPAERINELRIQLASEGLPQGGKIGFEIFDQNNLGMTEFIERVSYRRALEGELARTILSLKEIGQVRVHLVLPKESLFQDKSEPTKASVVLKLKSGKQLSESVVSGIVHLVSSAVEGLTPTNVTVVDANGRLLSGATGTPEEALTVHQVELKTRAEKELTAKVVNILEPVVGQGKVKADTSVAMDFSQIEQTEEKFDPQPVIRSQQKNDERSEPSATSVAAGVPGTKSNDANPAPVFIPTTRTASSSQKQSETTNYEVSKVVRHTLEPVGAIRRISVAVIVDDAVRTEKGQDGNPVRTAVPRSSDDLKKIKDLVSAAVGIDPNRGDLLTIENIAFDVPQDMEEVPPTVTPEWRNLIRPALRYGAIILLFLMAYLLVIRPITNKLLAPADLPNRVAGELADRTAAPGLSLATPKTVKELEAALNDGTNTAMVPSSEVRKADILRQRIAELVQKEPEKGAQLLRSWMIENGKG
jgi:flagellar M-ring protein FliF